MCISTLLTGRILHSPIAYLAPEFVPYMDTFPRGANTSLEYLIHEKQRIKDCKAGKKGGTNRPPIMNQFENRADERRGERDAAVYTVQKKR